MSPTRSLLLVLACASSSACASPPPRPAVTTTSATASHLLGRERASRLERVADALGHALADWKVEGRKAPCTLVFDAEGQWLAGCTMKGRPPGFVATGETVLAEPVLWKPKSLALGDSVVPWEKAKMAVVGTVASQTNAEGATFPVLVLQDWDALHAHHPGFVDAPMVEWLGVAVHEAFHAHQLFHPSIRARTEAWRGRTIATVDDLAAFYTTNGDYRRAVDEELAVLRSATAAEGTPAEAREALAHWARLRERRKATFGAALEAAHPGKEAWEVDGFMTFLEGTARYVEARFLADTTSERPAYARSGLSGGSKRYVYALGMYVAFLLDRASPGWKARILDDRAPLLDEVTRITG